MSGYRCSAVVVAIALASTCLAGCGEGAAPAKELLKDQVKTEAEEMAKASDQEQQKAAAAGKGGAAGSGSFGQLGSETGSKSSLAGDGGSKKEAWHEKKLEQSASERREVTAKETGQSKPPTQNVTRPTSFSQNEESQVDGIHDAEVHRVARRFNKTEKK